jgi:hypothetical protein
MPRRWRLGELAEATVADRDRLAVTDAGCGLSLPVAQAHRRSPPRLGPGPQR